MKTNPPAEAVFRGVDLAWQTVNETGSRIQHLTQELSDVLGASEGIPGAERAKLSALIHALLTEVSDRDLAYVCLIDAFRLTVVSAPKELRKQQARAGARAKLKNDPKQAAKLDVKAFYDEWRANMHPRLRKNEQFAMEAQRRHPELSLKVILGWVTAWDKEAKKKSQPAS
jgi:hypothetical protein